MALLWVRGKTRQAGLLLSALRGQTWLIEKRKQITMPQTDAWQYHPILERELTTRRPAGGTIRSAEIAQLPSREWILHARVSWRDDNWLNVSIWEQPPIKHYNRSKESRGGRECVRRSKTRWTK